MIKCYKVVFIIVLSSILLACSASDSVGKWIIMKIHKDITYAELVNIERKFKPVIVWSTDIGDKLGDYSNRRSWLQGKMIIAVDNEGKVSSYEKSTGHLLWQVRLNTPIISGVGGGDNGLILVGSTVGEVLALDETNGELLWRNSLSSEILAPPKGSQDIVVAQSADGRLTGLSADNGDILWSYRCAVPPLSLRGTSAPIIIGEKVVSGYANGKLIALSIIDGRVIWDKQIFIPRGKTDVDRIVDIDITPVIRAGRIYVVSHHGNATVIDLDNGKILWVRRYLSNVGLDVAHNLVYISDIYDHIWAFYDDSGDVLWRQINLLGREITAPIVMGDTILVGDLEGYVHWISRASGNFVARLQVSNDAIRSRPIVMGDMVYVTSVNGKLTALRI